MCLHEKTSRHNYFVDGCLHIIDAAQVCRINKKTVKTYFLEISNEIT